MPKLIENAKEKIITEGRKILLNKNYKELSIREIAKQCGIAVGTFYNYFSTKEDLVIEIFKDDWNKVFDLTKKLRDMDDTFKNKIACLYEVMDEFISKYITIFYEIAMLNGYEQKEIKEIDKFTFIYTELALIIEDEKKKGNIKSKIESLKLAQLIVSNLIYLSKNKYMTFDELYESITI